LEEKSKGMEKGNLQSSLILPSERLDALEKNLKLEVSFIYAKERHKNAR